MKTPSSAPRRLLRRAGAAVAILVGASAFVLLLAVLAFGAAFLGGPAFVELLNSLHGR